MNMPLRWLGIMLAFAGPAQIAMSSDVPRDTLVRAGRLWDAEAGRMLDRRDILIRGDRVVSVGIDLPVPAGALVINAVGCSVLPDLIDAHTHILSEQRSGESLTETIVRERTSGGDVLRVLAAVPRGRQYLEAGITTVRDLGNSGRFLDLMMARAVADGSIAGPRIVGSGPGLAPAGGQLDPLPTDSDHLIDSEYRVIHGVEDARVAVRDAIARGVGVIKMYAEASPQRTRLSKAEMVAIVDEAHRHRIPVAAHATTDEAITEAVEAGVSSIEHGYGASEATLRLMARKGVWLVPTDPSLDMASEFARHWPTPPPREDIARHLRHGRDRLAAALRMNVRVALGSDLYTSYVPGRGEGTRSVLEGYVDGGMTPKQALRSATWEGGQLIGDPGLGVVQAGGWADLVAVQGDPSADIRALRNVRYVVARGRVAVPFQGCASD